MPRHRLFCRPFIAAGVATRFLSNRLHSAVGSVSEVIYGELLLGVMDPGLVHDGRDPTGEHSCRDIACIDFWLYKFRAIWIELVNVLFLSALVIDLVRSSERRNDLAPWDACSEQTWIFVYRRIFHGDVLLECGRT